MSADLPDTLRGAVDVGGDVSNVTPARLLIGRAGTAYRTSTQLQLRADHAFAKDALNATFSLEESPILVANTGRSVLIATRLCRFPS